MDLLRQAGNNPQTVCEPVNDTLSAGRDDDDRGPDGASRTYGILGTGDWEYVFGRSVGQSVSRSVGTVATNPK